MAEPRPRVRGHPPRPRLYIATPLASQAHQQLHYPPLIPPSLFPEPEKLSSPSFAAMAAVGHRSNWSYPDHLSPFHLYKRLPYTTATLPTLSFPRRSLHGAVPKFAVAAVHLVRRPSCSSPSRRFQSVHAGAASPPEASIGPSSSGDSLSRRNHRRHPASVFCRCRCHGPLFSGTTLHGEHPSGPSSIEGGRIRRGPAPAAPRPGPPLSRDPSKGGRRRPQLTTPPPRGFRSSVAQGVDPSP